MDINVATEKDYSEAIRNLFPKGEYWEKQFSDPRSDLNLFCMAKTKEIIRLRRRMGDLLAESDCQTAEETINDWERVLLGYLNNQLPLDERRQVLTLQKTTTINRIFIADIAQKYGLSLIDILFPFKTSFFGFSEFGRSIFSRPAFYSVFYIIVAFQDEGLKNEAVKHKTELLNRSSFGYGYFGTGQFLGRSFFCRDYSSRVFTGMKTLDDFENDINSEMYASNIALFLYKF